MKGTYMNGAKPYHRVEDVAETAKHLASMARKFVNGNASVKEVEEAIRWWRDACSAKWPPAAPSPSPADWLTHVGSPPTSALASAESPAPRAAEEPMKVPAWFGPALGEAMKADFVAHVEECTECQRGPEHLCETGRYWLPHLDLTSVSDGERCEACGGDGRCRETHDRRPGHKRDCDERCDACEGTGRSGGAREGRGHE